MDHVERADASVLEDLDCLGRAGEGIVGSLVSETRAAGEEIVVALLM